ncbi:hypothetical protein EGR_11094 [Echinococcus granulosus]|uniref:DUF5741 domain-containing protein n=1 Tax=Echinococcus granulosus TaxID=6210 RepID=W6TZ96_ECHGR|nr:hypothetical protein EGR_11094 [Echinococcus granulosus]EUB54048.1 hypothetical protein EGR_11094 [Echinococcus granulosus]
MSVPGGIYEGFCLGVGPAAFNTKNSCGGDADVFTDTERSTLRATGTCSGSTVGYVHTGIVYCKRADSTDAIGSALAAEEVSYTEMEQILNRVSASVAEWEAKISLAEDTEHAFSLSAKLEESVGRLLRLLNGLISERVMSRGSKHTMMGQQSTLPEVTESKVAPAENRCQQLPAHQGELVVEVGAEDVHVVIPEVDTECRVMHDERLTTESTTNITVTDDGIGRIDETMPEKARKYPELKSIAFGLRARFAKRAELQASSMKEARGLKSIVMKNERRVRRFAEELERI